MPLSKDDYADIKIIAEDHPDFDVFKNKTEQDVVFTKIAYKFDEKTIKEITDQVPDNYQLLLVSDYIADLKEYEYRCAVFVDYKNKEVVLATAGTRPGFTQKFLYDLMDDAMLAIEQKPFKTSASFALNDILLDNLKEEARNFTFHYTGHSLGAAMAEISAADMDIKMQSRGLRNKGEQKQISAVTFETPGTLKILEKMYKKSGLDFSENVKDLNFKSINNRDNIINASAEQSGKVYNIVPSDQDEREPNWIQRLAVYMAEYAFRNSDNILGRLVGKVCLLFAPGGLETSLLTEHAFKNFKKVFVEEKGIVREKNGPVISLSEAISGKQQVEYDAEIYQKINELKAKNGDLGNQQYEMSKFDPETESIKKITFSEMELSSASIANRTNQKSSVASEWKNANKNSLQKVLEEGKTVNAPRISTYREILSSSKGKAGGSFS